MRKKIEKTETPETPEEKMMKLERLREIRLKAFRKWYKKNAKKHNDKIIAKRIRKQYTDNLFE